MTNKEIQQALIDHGFDCGKAGADGDIGRDTTAALQGFQTTQGIPATGLADAVTIAALTKPIGRVLGGAIHVAPWLELARKELGIHEGVGSNNNPSVIKMFADAGFSGVKTDSTAWCAAFVGAMLTRAGIKPSGSLSARSYESWGVGLKEPVFGCIATKKRSGSSWQGHVGIVVGADAGHIIMLGGNQGDAVSIESFARNLKGSEFTSFRWPKGFAIPSPKDLPTTVAGAKKNVSEA